MYTTYIFKLFITHTVIFLYVYASLIKAQPSVGDNVQFGHLGGDNGYNSSTFLNRIEITVYDTLGLKSFHQDD